MMPKYCNSNITNDNETIILLSHQMVLKAPGPACFIQLTQCDTCYIFINNKQS